MNNPITEQDLYEHCERQLLHHASPEDVFRQEHELVKNLIDEVRALRAAKERIISQLCSEANVTTVDFCNGVFVNVDRAIDIVNGEWSA